jgi:hypothetical protein
VHNGENTLALPIIHSTFGFVAKTPTLFQLFFQVKHNFNYNHALILNSYDEDKVFYDYHT